MPAGSKSPQSIANGGVFGVGFLREYLKANYARTLDKIRAHYGPDDAGAVDAFLARRSGADRWIRKPFNGFALRRLVEQLVASRRAGAAAT